MALNSSCPAVSRTKILKYREWVQEELARSTFPAMSQDRQKAIPRANGCMQQEVHHVGSQACCKRTATLGLLSSSQANKHPVARQAYC